MPGGPSVSGHRDLDRLHADLGELLARHAGSRGGDHGRRRDDPVGFLREVLGAEPWEAQERVAEAVRDHPLVTVRSCHAAGKDWLAARLALWWVYARGGLVVLTGPTAAQVEEILMRAEVRAAFLAGAFPGELHVRALRPGGEGRAGILARTGTDVHALTGLHRARVLFVITEAQDPAIDHAWDAAFAVCTGEEDRVLAVGNPTEPDGRFWAAHQPGSGWHAVKIAAESIPNVREGRTVVPGLLTREGVERIRREYGEGSPFYVSRVLAEFPSEAADSLVLREWLDRARARFISGELEPPERTPFTLGVDPARLGPDRTAVVIRQGAVVRGFETWNGLDTMATAARVRDLAARLLADHAGPGFGDVAGVEAVLVDEVGLGGGVLDRLRETLPALEWVEVRGEDRYRPRAVTRRPEARAFNASKAAGLPERFRNLRAQAYWRLRKLLEEGALALPDGPDGEALAEELLSTRVRFGADGRTEIEGKDALKARLGRSPDLADALVISLAAELAAPGRWEIAFR